MKVEKIFEVLCHEPMFSDKEFHIAVFGTETNKGREFSVVYSELENFLEDEYPDRSTFERIHGEPRWYDDFEDVSEELVEFPWTRGLLCYQQGHHKVCKSFRYQ